MLTLKQKLRNIQIANENPTDLRFKELIENEISLYEEKGGLMYHKLEEDYREHKDKDPTSYYYRVSDSNIFYVKYGSNWVVGISVPHESVLPTEEVIETISMNSILKGYRIELSSDQGKDTWELNGVMPSPVNADHVFFIFN